MCVANPNRKAVWSRGGRFVKLGHWWNVRQTGNSNLSPRNHEWQKQQDGCSYNEGRFDPNPESSVWRIVNGFVSSVERAHGCSCINEFASSFFFFCHRQKPPIKALRLLPRRVP